MAEVSDTAAKLRSTNQLMYDDLTAMQKEITSLMVLGFLMVVRRFAIVSIYSQIALRSIRVLIDAYAKFLDTTVSSYDH